MSFKDLKLGTKQKVGFGAILIILAVVNIFAIKNMAALKAEINEVTANWLPRAIAISDINLNTSYLRLNQLQLAFTTDEEKKQEQAEIMIGLIDRINENLDTYEKLKADSERRNLYSEEEGKLYAEFDRNWEEYQDLSLIFLKLLRDNMTREAIELLNGEARTVFNDFSADLVALVGANKKNSIEAAKRSAATYRSTRNVSVVLLVGTIVFSVLLAGFLMRLITLPVQQLAKAASTVAEGDLDVRLEILSQDEIGNLAQSFNQMTISLREAREKMQRQAEKLRITNKELEENSRYLAQQKAEIEQKNLDLERALQELRDTQERLLLKEKMASLGFLVAGVAHEINNPIGTVTSSTDVSGRCVARLETFLDQSESLEELKDNKEFIKVLDILKENIKVILTAGDRVATIVKSLRNFAALDETEYQRVDLHEGIDSTLTLLENEFRGRISVVKEYGQIPKIECYAGELNQVFINLLKNASQAIEGSGTIVIRTFVENNHIHVQISDTGKGIPRNKLAKIFDFGFSATGSRVKMGSGLSTAYNIVQKHNGEIRVKSEVGKGSTFTVVLPQN